MVRKKRKVIAIVQSRLTSARFLNKVIKKIGKYTLSEILYKRLSRSKNIDQIIFAVPENKQNEKLGTYLRKIGIKVETGSENNVLKRYYQTAKKYNASVIVRITGDCPLIDPKLVDKMISIFLKNKPEHLQTHPFSFPDGFDFEILSFKTLEFIYKKAKSKFDLQHVTPYIKNEKNKLKIKKETFKIGDYFGKDNDKFKENFGFIKLSVDVKEDLSNVQKVFKYFHPNIFFSLEDIFKNNLDEKIFSNFYFKKNFLKNKTISGQNLWNKAKKIIPNGNMLLSKNPDRYLPDLWPTYFKSAKGCKITDLDDNQYIDFSTMGVGTNVLGYGDPEVDSAVRKTISSGNMSTLNCPEEVKLAEKLISLHPWFDMVRFARTGGEANSVAIRIARAAAGKDNVAICGYHGWHDWYLSANLNSKDGKNLNTHLLNGLEIQGVPKKLKKTVFPFNYGDFDTLKKLVNKNSIGVIKMEVCRNTAPDITFLKKVRNLANKKKIVLIFDECTTGFRQCLGGLHRQTGVKPDMAIFGKALGNGYAITAIVGKKSVMESAQKSFISSTFWTERIGTTAALKTIEVMEKKKSWINIDRIGKKIQNGWKTLAKDTKIKIQVNGIPTLTSFKFLSEKNQIYKTLITQEMLKNNILAANSVYPCVKHNDKVIDKYFNNLEKIFKIISLCETGFDIRKYLKSKVSMKGFKRLN
tara:strand:- start:3405 stop:5489 length:2085 start_codon:yes stop_codon:yes gene_type:complete